MTDKLWNPPVPSKLVLHSSLEFSSTISSSTRRLLIVGDIHGCFDELMELINLSGIDYSKGDQLICVGDLVAKGEKSFEVIQYLVEHQSHCHAVLGNHDAFLLRVALLQGRLGSEKFKDDSSIGCWTPQLIQEFDIHSSIYAKQYYARMNGFHEIAKHDMSLFNLSDQHLNWLAHLPLTINLASIDLPYIITHAGLIPNLTLDKQHPFHLMTMRNLNISTSDGKKQYQAEELLTQGIAWSMVLSEEEENYLRTHQQQQQRQNDDPVASSISSKIDTSTKSESTLSTSQASSPLSSSTRPPTIIFGHDAMRGIQRPNIFRLGIDTGCCNGHSLTGFILPDERLVSVRAHRKYKETKFQIDTTRTLYSLHNTSSAANTSSSTSSASSTRLNVSLDQIPIEEPSIPTPAQVPKQ